MRGSVRRLPSIVSRVVPRAVLLPALAGCALIWLAVAVWPTREARAHRRLERILSALDGRAPGGWENPGRRADVIELFAELQREGDERALSKLAEGLMARTQFAPEELDRILDLAFHDFNVWNTVFPAWKLDILRKWMSFHSPQEDARWNFLLKNIEVDVMFKAPPNKFRRLYLQGNWNEGGELDDLGGWRPVALQDDGRHGDGAAQDGAWGVRLALRLTRLRHLYRAVVRTAPWPDGVAVGSADFAVTGPRRRVVIAERRFPASARARTAGLTPTARGPRAGSRPGVGVSLLGIDGATWHLILPWVHQGRLPNFGRLLREGAVATLVSSPSENQEYVSMPNISGALTGMLAFRHGMASAFYKTNLGRKSSPLWKIFSDQGRRVAVVSMWGTFPADAVLGELVTDAYFTLELLNDPGSRAITQGSQVDQFAPLFGVTAADLRRLARFQKFIGWAMDTTYPPGLARELHESLAFHPAGVREGISALSREADDLGIQATLHLLGKGPFGLLCAYLCDVDAASHLYWSDVEPHVDPAMTLPAGASSGGAGVDVSGGAQGAASNGKVLQAYEAADRLLGSLIDRSSHVVVFSDHGFGATPEPSRVVITVANLDRLRRISEKQLGIRWPAEAEFDNEGETFIIRLSKSVPRESVRKLEGFLRGMTYLPGGQAVFSPVSAESSPDRVTLKIVQRPLQGIAVGGVAADGARYAVKDLFDLTRLQSEHMGNGIFAAIGPGIEPGRIVEPAYIADVAPTVLYLAGLPIARDMDGRLIRDAMGKGRLEAFPPATVATYGSGGSGLRRLLKAVRWSAVFRRVFTRRIFH